MDENIRSSASKPIPTQPAKEERPKQSLTKKILIRGGLAAAIIAAIYYWYNIPTGYEYNVPPRNVYNHKGLEGPLQPSIVEVAGPTSWQKYSGGSSSRFCIYLTDTNSDWLGLALGFKSFGIPFTITRDIDQVVKHNVVLAYPILSGKALNTNEIQKLAAHARSGHTVIATDVAGGGFNDVFGFKEMVVSRTRFKMQLATLKEPALSIFDHANERVISLGNARHKETMGSRAFTDPVEKPWATYEDGSAAIVGRKYGKGLSLAIGIDVGRYIHQAYNARMLEAERTYINDYEPSVDVVLRMLKELYMQHEPAAVSLYTVPYGRDLAVTITHDIDYTRSIEHAVDYAAYEKSQGIEGTYFIQTKYIKDWNDDIFFDKEGVENLKQIRAHGMEVGSHSVAHSFVYSKFGLGTGKESYPDYKPYVMERMKAYNGSVLGELRVSKFLLESSAPDVKVTSFRPGHLSYPFKLPEALKATGYTASSSQSANTVLTHLPYQLSYARDYDQAVDVYEFPVTVEDELIKDPQQWYDRTISLANLLSEYGAYMNLLIHTDTLAHKLEYEKKVVAALKDKAWIGSIRQFSSWWRLRDQVEVDSRQQGNDIIVTLRSNADAAGLGLVVPKGYRVASITNTGRSELMNGRDVISILKGSTEVTLKRGK